MSSAKTPRPGLAIAPEVARAGDVLTVCQLDRQGRALHDLIVLGRKLDRMGIGLMSAPAKIDTSSGGGRLVFHVFGTLAESERNLVRGRKSGWSEVLGLAQTQTPARGFTRKQH